ncbi:hypothetical protein TNCT_452791, partial [Trichonephila clavata]
MFWNNMFQKLNVRIDQDPAAHGQGVGTGMFEMVLVLICSSVFVNMFCSSLSLVASDASGSDMRSFMHK